MKVAVLMTVVCLSACSWFGSRKHPVPDPPVIIVTGAPGGSIVYLDGVPSGQTATASDRAQELEVAAGAHTVEIHLGDKVVYREDTYVGAGERRVVTVLSGSGQ